jgi:sigma-E factor negative regulatory protein RseB
MRRGAARALLLSIAWLAIAPTAAKDGVDDGQGEQWLSRMSTALATLDYVGTFVYVRDGQVDALRVWHRVDDDGAHERLVSLSGELREMSRHGPLARLSGGARASASPRRAPSGTVPIDLAALQPSYQLAVGDSDRIAGLPTRILEVRPRDGFRYGYRLWLEQASALPLKSVAYGSDGRAVEQWMFTEISIGTAPTDAELWPGTRPAAAPTAPPVQMLDPAGARWQVRDGPRGFRLALLAAGGSDGEHHVYSDGLARVSLYVEPLAADAPNLSGLLRRGALSVFGRVVDGHQVTVVGEVPPATVERMAQGVVARDGG